MKTFQVSRVYYVTANTYEEAVAQLPVATRTCRIDFESVRLWAEELSATRAFLQEAVRQLTGFTQKQEPRHES